MGTQQSSSTGTPSATTPQLPACAPAPLQPWHGENFAWWMAMAAMTPSVYGCVRTNPDSPPQLDGDIHGAAWQAAPWSSHFQDIQGQLQPAPRFKTQMKMMWDDDWLWVGTWMEEPQLVASITQKNAVMYKDNDFEIFIDPDADNHNYYEFEANALNTIWELKLEKPYKDGGPAIDPCNLQGTACSVKLNGILNNPATPSRGWGMVVRLPLAEIAAGYNKESRSPPKAGEYWRINFSRVEWRYKVTAEGLYEKVAGLPEDNWVWSPQGIIDMHRPEQWGYVVFQGQEDSIICPQPNLQIPDHAYEARRAVMQVYHLQRDYKAFYGKFAATLRQLGIKDTCVMELGKEGSLPKDTASCHAQIDAVQQSSAADKQAEGFDVTQMVPVCGDDADHGVLIDGAGNEIGVDDGSAAAGLEYVCTSQVQQSEDGMEKQVSPPQITLSEDGGDYEVTCTQRARGRVLVVHSRSDSLIWVTES